METRPWIVKLNLRGGSLESVAGVNLPCVRDVGIGFAVALNTNIRCLSGESKSFHLSRRRHFPGFTVAECVVFLRPQRPVTR